MSAGRLGSSPTLRRNATRQSGTRRPDVDSCFLSVTTASVASIPVMSGNRYVSWLAWE